MEATHTEAELLSTALDTLPMNIAILDADGTIQATNRGWREFAEAYKRQMKPETAGESFLTRIEAADDSYVSRAAAGVRAVLQGERDQFDLEFPCRTTGGPRWFQLRAAPFTQDGNRYVAFSHTEATERKTREQALRDAYEISTATDQSFDEQIDELLELVRDVLGTSYGTLSSVYDGKYVFEAVTAPPDASLEAGTTTLLETLPNCERVVETERTLVRNDVATEAPELVDPEWGIASYLGAPVIVDGEVYGTFCFYSMEPRAEAFPEWAVTFVDLLSNWVSYELEHREHVTKLQQLKEHVTDVVWMTGPKNDEIQFISDSYEDVWGRSPATVYEDRISFIDTIHPDDRDQVRNALVAQQTNPDEFEETYRVVQPDGEIRWVHDRAAGVYDGDGTLQRIVGVATDITDRKEREQMLERQRDDLAELQRLNTLSRGVTQALQETTTRDAIEHAVCEQLTESELYQTVWIGIRGTTETGDLTVRPQTAAGVGEDYLDDISGISGPAKQALQTGEMQVINDIASDERFPDARRDTAVAHNHCALAAVPLMTEEMTYGVLVVYLPEGQTINDAEQAVLCDLSSSTALAIQRVHSQRALAAETVVTLDFQIPDAGFVFGEVSAELDCELIFQQRVMATDETSIYYFTVKGADPTCVCERLQSAAPVVSGTVVREGEDSRPVLIELQLKNTPRLPVDVLTDYGAKVTTARVDAGDFDFSVDIHEEVHLRELLHDLHEIAPTVELVRKHHTERPVTVVESIHQAISDQLTPKQAAALEAAYARGYYAWPRDSTMEEIADTFDVSAPTLHYRLRKAHQTVMRTLFDGERT